MKKEEIDPILKDVITYVVESQRCSGKELQRKFETGYARTGRLIEALEKMGIVSQASNSERKVLAQKEDLEGYLKGV